MEINTHQCALQGNSKLFWSPVREAHASHHHGSLFQCPALTSLGIIFQGCIRGFQGWHWLQPHDVDRQLYLCISFMLKYYSGFLFGQIKAFNNKSLYITVLESFVCARVLGVGRLVSRVSRGYFDMYIYIQGRLYIYVCVGEVICIYSLTETIIENCARNM